MSNMFESKKIEFTCPKCQRQISETVGRLTRGNYSCPGCGSIVDATELRQGIEKVERDIKDTFRKIGQIKIDIKL